MIESLRLRPPPQNGGLEDAIFDEDFAFYSKRDRKPMKVFEQGNHIIWLTV